MSNVLVIGDTQLPFEHEDYFDFCAEVYRKFRCNKVVHIGDWWDFHALSNYPTHTGAMSYNAERDKAIRRSKRWYKKYPDVSICKANHDERPDRRAEAAGLPDWARARRSDVFQSPPGWKWRDTFIIDNVYYEHGHHLFPGRGPGWKTATKLAVERRGVSTVFGHLHTVWGVVGCRNRAGRLFGMATGCGIDERKYAFYYSKNADNVLHGCAVVTDGNPHAIQMQLDRHYRWTGKL